MKDKKSVEVLLLVVILLFAVSVPLQYLVRKEVVVGVPADVAAQEAEEHAEEAQFSDNQPGPTEITVTNFGFEVGTREQIWGWSQVGTDQGAVIFRDEQVAHRGFASAAVDSNGAFVNDSGWFTKLAELPRDRQLEFRGYIKTRDLRGEAYLRIICEGAVEGSEQPQLLASVSTDDLHGTNDWTLSSLRCFIPPEATGVWLEAGLFGRGQAWFDDLTLQSKEREDDLPLGQNLLRNAALSDGASSWHMLTSTSNPVLDYGQASAGQSAASFFINRKGATNEDFTSTYQSVWGLYGHKGTLAISGRLRSEGLAGTAFLAARLFKADGETGFRSANSVSGNSDWSDLNVKVDVSGSVDDVWVLIEMSGSGTVYVEGLSAVFEEAPNQ
jgi:hypothetical protein